LTVGTAPELAQQQPSVLPDRPGGTRRTERRAESARRADALGRRRRPLGDTRQRWPLACSARRAARTHRRFL